MKRLFIPFLLVLLSICVSGNAQQILHSHIKYDSIACRQLKIDNPTIKNFLCSVVDTVKEKGYNPEMIVFTLLVEPLDSNSIYLNLTFRRSSEIGYASLISLQQFREGVFVKRGEGENIGVCIIDKYIFIVNGQIEPLKNDFSYLPGDFQLLVTGAADSEPPYWYAWWIATIKDNRLEIIKYDPPYPFNKTK